jgi:hypothetical protein
MISKPSGRSPIRTPGSNSPTTYSQPAARGPAVNVTGGSPPADWGGVLPGRGQPTVVNGPPIEPPAEVGVPPIRGPVVDVPGLTPGYPVGSPPIDGQFPPGQNFSDTPALGPSPGGPTRNVARKTLSKAPQSNLSLPPEILRQLALSRVIGD